MPPCNGSKIKAQNLQNAEQRLHCQNEWNQAPVDVLPYPDGHFAPLFLASGQRMRCAAVWIRRQLL